MDFNHFAYDKLVSTSKNFKIKVKQKIKSLNNYDELVDFYNESILEDYKYNNSYIEGFVLEDSNKKMVKIKCNYYNFWKKIRGYCMRISKGKLCKDITIPKKEKDVLDFVIENKLQDTNVITIAKLYYKKITNEN
jgi:ribosomal protein S17